MMLSLRARAERIYARTLVRIARTWSGQGVSPTATLFEREVNSRRHERSETRNIRSSVVSDSKLNLRSEREEQDSRIIQDGEG